MDGLPGDSLYKTAVRDSLTDEELAKLATRTPSSGYGPWSHEALRLAAIEDQIKLLRRELVAVNGQKPPGKFEPVYRPGVARPKRKALTAEGIAYLQRLRAEHEQRHRYGAYADIEPTGGDSEADQGSDSG